MPNSQENPYEAPQAVVRDRFRGTSDARLASRASRLGAVILDGLIGILIGVPAVIAVVMDENMEGIGVAALALTALLGLGLFIYNLILLAQNGWTLGKKICGIRIVRTDGSDAGLGRIFWLRMIVNGLIGSIPIVGMFYSLIDPLFIFGEAQRCVHDYIADTIVVEA